MRVEITTTDDVFMRRLLTWLNAQSAVRTTVTIEGTDDHPVPVEEIRKNDHS